MTLQMTSSAFIQGQPIPKKYTGEGTDVSPPLDWTGIPEGTQELVLICDDPTPPCPTGVHWVSTRCRPTRRVCRRACSRKARLKEPPGALAGEELLARQREIGYRGPMPPPGHGVHHYHFKLYALEARHGGRAGLGQEGRYGGYQRPRAGGRRVDGDVMTADK